MSGVNFLGDNGPDGMTMGTSATEKISFFGATPVIQQAVTVNTTATATTALNEQRLVRLEAALVNLGLVTTAG